MVFAEQLPLSSRQQEEEREGRQEEREKVRKRFRVYKSTERKKERRKALGRSANYANKLRRQQIKLLWFDNN